MPFRIFFVLFAIFVQTSWFKKCNVCIFPAIFIAVSTRQQLLKLRNKIYRKTQGRAYRSYFSCIEYSCPGQVIFLELKGGEIKIIAEHNPDCTSDYYKNRPAEYMDQLNEEERTRLEETLSGTFFD